MLRFKFFLSSFLGFHGYTLLLLVFLSVTVVPASVRQTLPFVEPIICDVYSFASLENLLRPDNINHIWSGPAIVTCVKAAAAKVTRQKALQAKPLRNTSPVNASAAPREIWLRPASIESHQLYCRMHANNDAIYMKSKTNLYKGNLFWSFVHMM